MMCHRGYDDVIADISVVVDIVGVEAHFAFGDEEGLVVHFVPVLRGARGTGVGCGWRRR